MSRGGKLPLLGRSASLLCFVFALCFGARGSSLSTSVLGMFPKNMGEIGYANLKSARQTAWFPQFEAQALPLRFRRFEEFLRSAGVDADTQVEEVAWGATSLAKPPVTPGEASTPDNGGTQAYTGQQVVGIALGSFTPDLVDQAAKKQMLPTITVRGFTLYAFGSGISPGDLFFFFVDSNTIAFGHRDVLEALIGVRFGEQDSFLQNETLWPLVSEVNGQGTLWLALDKDSAHLSIERLIPEAAQFPGASDLLGRVKGMTVTLQVDSGLDAQVTPLCGSPADAQTLAQLLQAGLMYKRYQLAQTNPDAAKLIDDTSVSSDGDHLKVHTQAPNELVQTLLKSGLAFYN